MNRDQFEKLEEVKNRLSEYIVFVGNKYTTPNEGFYDLVNWLNGAWYAWQEQQKKINETLEIVADYRDVVEGLLK